VGVDVRLLGDRYRLGALLGRGSAGRVFEAVDVVLGRPVAVKLYQSSDNTVGRYRFAAEARLLAGLSHPGLVTVYDVCVDAEEPYLVMRLVKGPTLRKLLDRGPFEPPAVARIGAQLTDALAYVHAHDVVHRDIKPSNVLVDASGACHLTDFGLARALGAAHLTVSGEFVGTAAYVAPEQITDVDTGPPADI
jgi:eukaryotic-like serine/threonine-protein kinase